MGGEEARILSLPLVAVGLHVAVMQTRLQVRRLVEEHPEEEVRVEVAVDGNLVERMTFAWPAVVAKLRASLASDVEMYLVVVEEVIDHGHRLCREVVGEYPAIVLLLRQNVGQSQSLRLCLCMFTLLLHAASDTLARIIKAISRRVVFFFIIALTP